MAVKDDLKKSAEYVKRYEYTILKLLNASKLIACENKDDEVAKLLDRSCGIDYILVSEDGHTSRGLACRLQEDRFNEKYRTFTVRRSRDSGVETEYKKKKKAIEGGGLYPSLTLQGYIDTENDRIDRLAVVRTEELIDYCENDRPDIRHTGRGNVGQASFYVVDWDRYRASGRWILIAERGEEKGESKTE